MVVEEDDAAASASVVGLLNLFGSQFFKLEFATHIIYIVKYSLAEN